MAELRISEFSAGPGQVQQVELAWADGRARRSAVAHLDGTRADGQDGELIRWYLEEYAEFPAEPAPARVRLARSRRIAGQSG